MAREGWRKEAADHSYQPQLRESAPEYPMAKQRCYRQSEHVGDGIGEVQASFSPSLSSGEGWGEGD